MDIVIMWSIETNDQRKASRAVTYMSRAFNSPLCFQVASHSVRGRLGLDRVSDYRGLTVFD